MAYWNHFRQLAYKQILFGSLDIGEVFRKDFFKGKRRRKDILCIKTSELTFIEKKSKVEHKLHFDNGYEVSSAVEKIKN